MAKIYGLFGAMTGKLAETVMTVRNGEQIARKYQPVVYNPNTPAQVATRAKMKLMSQLSAVMSPVIAIPREGIVSSRNKFVSVNYRKATFTDNTADITLSAVQLTKSVVALPAVNATRSGSAINIELAAAATVDRVVYAVFAKQADNTLRYVTSSVVATPGQDSKFPYDPVVGTEPMVVYAYGVRDNTEAARVIFGNMQALTAETVAKVVTSRALLETDITLTETQGAEVAGTTPNMSVAPAANENREAKKK